jgi:hypothetical protein
MTTSKSYLSFRIDPTFINVHVYGANKKIPLILQNSMFCQDSMFCQSSNQRVCFMAAYIDSIPDILYFFIFNPRSNFNSNFNSNSSTSIKQHKQQLSSLSIFINCIINHRSRFEFQQNIELLLLLILWQKTVNKLNSNNIHNLINTRSNNNKPFPICYDGELFL